MQQSKANNTYKDTLVFYRQVETSKCKSYVSIEYFRMRDIITTLHNSFSIKIRDKNRVFNMSFEGTNVNIMAKIVRNFAFGS